MKNISCKNSKKINPNNRLKKIFNLTIFTLLTVICFAGTAEAVVTVDSTSSDRDSATLGLDSITWSHTVGTGSERALYVGVSSSTRLLPVSVAPELLSVAGVTYNGIPMTRVGSVQSAPIPLLGNLLSKSYVDVYRLVNPPSGTHNIVVNFSTLGIIPLDIFVNQAVGGAVSYNGVDQTTPNSFFASNSGNSTSPNLVVNGGTNQDLIMDVLASSPNAEDFTPAAGQTPRWEGNFPQVVLIPPYDLGAGSTKDGAASVSMNWTLENGNSWALGGLAIRAASNPPSVFTVNTNLDNESNGCAVGNCTLREAINDANNTAQPDTINFAPSVTGTITLTNGQLVAYSDMTINGPGARNLAVSGDNSTRVFLIATPLLGGDVTVNISGLTIRNGNAQPVLLGSTLIGDGGGILNGALLGILSGTSTLNLTEVNVSNNQATTLGGGIATRLGARTNISRSLISNNFNNALLPVGIPLGDVGGGGISNVAATTNVYNSTITNNNTLAAGGGILNAAGTVNLSNNTISHNRSTLAGGGVVSVAGIITPLLGVANVRNTIIANNNDLLGLNVLGRDVVGVLGSFNSLGNNLIGSNFGAALNFQASVFVGISPQPNVNLDIVGGVAVGNQVIDPLLGELQDNGGPTDTRVPYGDSPVIDRGNNCVTTNTCSPNPQNNNPSAAYTLEQRGAGYTRLSGAAVDIGATETIIRTVTSLLDNENDGCGVGSCTVREAINDSNDAPQPDVIVFLPGLTGTVTLVQGPLVISSDITLNGGNTRNITISGNNTDRVFIVAIPVIGGNVRASVRDLTVTGGLAPTGSGGDGGGVLNGTNLGALSGIPNLTLTDVSVAGNQALTSGGGISTRSGSVTTIIRSTISGNNANGASLGNGGGGIINNNGVVNILNSTIANNSSLTGGGVLNNGGILNLTNDTIAKNDTSLAGAGIVNTGGGVTNMRNTLIASNVKPAERQSETAGRDVVTDSGTFNSLGNNMIGDNTGAETVFPASTFSGSQPQPNVNGDYVGNTVVPNQIINPKISPLQNNGGKTDTLIPDSDSPVAAKGNQCVLTNTCSTALPFALTTDQRGNGYPRQQNAAVDIGATETLAPTAAGATVAGRITHSNGKGIFRATVSLINSSGESVSTMSNISGQFEFQGIDTQQMYVLKVHHKQYSFTDIVITPTTDLLNINLVGTPSGGGLSSF